YPVARQPIEVRRAGHGPVRPRCRPRARDVAAAKEEILVLEPTRVPGALGVGLRLPVAAGRIGEAQFSVGVFEVAGAVAGAVRVQLAYPKAAGAEPLPDAAHAAARNDT